MGTLMRASGYIAFVSGLLVWSAVAVAQMTPEDVEQVGQRDPDVQQAITWDRLQTEVIYLRPSAPFKPDEKVQIEVPDPPESPEEVSREAKWTWGTIFFLILVVIIAVFIMQGNRINVSFRNTEERTRSTPAKRTGRDAPTDLPPLDGFLDRLARMPDRREALILLVGRALEQAATANGLTLARAQTARDVVRVIPNRWSHREPLRKLVREAEIVHFGGRDISEDRWRDCLDLARPMFGQGVRA